MNDNIILVAVFKDTWLVQFLNAEGIVIDSAEVAVGGTVSPTSVEVTPPPGQIFDSWYLGGSPYNFSAPVTGNIQLTPHFENTYYVYFISKGSAVSPQVVVTGGTATQPATPTRAGYTFLRWSLTDGGAAYNFNTPVTTDITLYAVWQAQQVNYTVVYWLEKPNVSGDPGTDVANYMYNKSQTRQACRFRDRSFRREPAGYRLRRVPPWGHGHHSGQRHHVLTCTSGAPCTR